MSTTYSTVRGDTFATVARKTYGDDTQALRIARANPGALEPLAPFTLLVIPPAPTAPRDVSQGVPSTNANEVAVSVDGERFRFWETATITRPIDTFDSITLTAPFNSESAEFRGRFRPLTFLSLDVTIGGNPLFTGTLVDVVPTVAPDRKAIRISGYALPGVLNDCNPSASAFPLEFNNQNLQQIASALLDPFGLAVEFVTEPGAAFERVACESGQTVWAFLIDLAKQRGLIMSSSATGALLFRRSATDGAPVARFVQGAPPLVAVTPSFSPQQYYSAITGIEPASVGKDGSQYTVRNSRLTTVTRPHNFSVDDVQGGDIRVAVESKMARMFGASVRYSVTLADIRDSAGNVWEPNTLISIEAPDAMIYTPYVLLIKSVTLPIEPTQRSATLDLVLPGAYAGRIPEALPWD